MRYVVHPIAVAGLAAAEAQIPKREGGSSRELAAREVDRSMAGHEAQEGQRSVEVELPEQDEAVYPDTLLRLLAERW